MTNIEFKRFTQPGVLEAIPIKHVWQFLQQFDDILRRHRVPVPTYLVGDEEFYRAWVVILKSPETLPAPFAEALLAIEELASPGNRSRLEEAVSLARPTHPWLDLRDPPETVAFQLWLISPYEPKGLPVPASHPTALSHPSPLPHANAEESWRGASAQATEASIVSGSQNVPAAPDTPSADPSPVTPISPAQAACRQDTNGSGSSPEPATKPLPPATLSPPASAPTQDSTNNAPLSTKRDYRHTGKIARLPHEVRESINMMIYDGVPYASIIARLGDTGKGLKPYHLTRWKKGGYQEWLQEQKRKDLAQSKEQFALHILREKDAARVHEASLQIASSQLCEFLADFDPAVLRTKLQNDPLNFVRLLNALSKLSESGINCESHRIEMAERQVQLEKKKEAPRAPGLSPEARRFIEEHRFNPPLR